MKNKRTRNKLTFAVLALCACFVVYGALYLFISDTRAAAEALSQKTLEQETFQNQKISAEALAKQIEPDLTTLSQFVISSSSDGDLAFIKNLEILAASQGTLFKIVSATQADQGDFTSLSFQATIEGKWGDVLRVTDLIQSMPYMISLSQAELTLIDDGSTPAPGKKKSPVQSRNWRAALSFSVLESK